MEGVEEQPPSKSGGMSGEQYRGDSRSYPLSEIMDRPPEAEGGNDFVGTKGAIRKVEFVRIIAMALQSFGYKNSVKLLESESGIELYTPAVTSFNEQVLFGNWDQSVATLRAIGVLDEDTIKRASVMILKWRLFELVDEMRYVDAMNLLRSETECLSVSDDIVREISACLLSHERCHVGADGQDTPKQMLRSELLMKLQGEFPPSVVIPKDRLLHLVEQSIDFQRDTCRLHNSGLEEISLLADHHCGTNKLPAQTSHVISGVEEQPPSKCVKVSSGETSGEHYLGDSGSYSMREIMDCLPEAEGGNEFVGSKGVIRKVDFVRIIAKALESQGYKNTGELLEGESGIHLHIPAVSLFIEHVLAGNWDQSVATLREIDLLDEEMIKRASVMILERRFFELVDENKPNDAVNLLKSERKHLSISDDRVKELTSCLLYPERCHLFGAYGQGTPKQKLRAELLVKLQREFPPFLLIAEDRLLHMVEQAIDFQRDTCRLHNDGSEEISLLADHHCGPDKLPTITSQVLQKHTDEIWFLQFSHDGKYLASASSDHTVIVWEVEADDHVVFKHKLNGHVASVFFISWSPDNKQLLSCGVEEVVRRWDVDTGECLCIYKKNMVGMVSCGWAPNGGSVYAGVNDGSIIKWDLEGNELQGRDQLPTIEISDLGILNNEGPVLAVSNENAVISVDLLHPMVPNMNPHNIIVEDLPIVSFSLSEDRKSMLLNLLDQEIHLWNIEGDSRLIGTYKGHKNNQFVVRSCFGGVNQGFVASGSEDLQVYIWLRKTGELITKLLGHSGLVNSVSWNPVNPQMLASASDDGTIRIWGLKKTNIEIGTMLASASDGKGHEQEGKICGNFGLKSPTDLSTYNIVNVLCSPVKNPSAPVYIIIGDGGNLEGLASNMTEPQPKYSAYREASFGHAILDIKNQTHAWYAWHRNQDGSAVEADSIWFFNRFWHPVDESTRC